MVRVHAAGEATKHGLEEKRKEILCAPKRIRACVGRNTYSRHMLTSYSCHMPTPYS